MSGYSQGVRVEHLVIADLQHNGYETQRAASSKGMADVVAIKAGVVLLVSCKRTTMPGPAERHALFALAMLLPGIGIPLVARKPKGEPLTYSRLIGTGPRDWMPWAPDFAVTL